jgi:hypothetical protein
MYLPPDFLNSREDAIIVWSVVILGYVISKDPRGLGGSFLGVLRALLQPKLMLLFGSALLYSALIVYGAKEIGLWHAAALKATIYWFIVTAVVLVGEAVARANPSDREFRRRVLNRVVGITILIEFMVNLYAFPLVYELALALLAISFVGMQVVLQHEAGADPRVSKLVDWVVIALVLIYLAHFLGAAIADVEGFLTREHAEDFLIGPVMTLALIPFLYGAAWVSHREMENLHKRFRSASNSPA